MKLHASLLAAACALALSACGGESPQSPDPAATPPAPVAEDADTVEPAPAPDAPWDQAPGDEAVDDLDEAGDPPAGDDADASPGDGGSAADADDAVAGATGCAIDLEGNDMMQFNLSTISVPSSCSEFTINLSHTGRLPEAAMGHNVVITAASDMAAVAADGISAGASAGYLKADDSRVIAASEMIGGGESTSVSFDVSKISSGGPYEFFCSFPGHAALMKGTISVD